MGISGTILRKLGPVTYQVDTGSGNIVKHHIYQLTQLLEPQPVDNTQRLEPQPVDIETPENPTVEDTIKDNFQYSNLVPVAEDRQPQRDRYPQRVQRSPGRLKLMIGFD